MKISFVVPAYNVEKYISQCLDSLINQTYKNIEIIVINDGSSDDTSLICQEYDRKNDNVIFINQKNQGVSAARNRGLDCCTGDWVFFVDGDDTVSHFLCEICLPYLNDKNDICFVEHKEGNRNGDENVLMSSLDVKKLYKDDFHEFLFAIFNRDIKGKYDYHKLKMATPCKFYRTKLLKDNKIVFPFGVPIGEDALFNLEVYRYIDNGIYIPLELYYHRLSENSVSHKFDKNCCEKFDLLHVKMKEYLIRNKIENKFEDSFNERCIWSVGFCCILNFCNKNNKISYENRKKEFKTYREKYIDQIKKVNLNKFRFQKKMLFFLIKFNCFGLTNLFCILKS